MKKVIYILIIFTVIIALVVVAIDIFIKEASKDKIYNNVKNIPKRDVALILGTAKYVSKGRINYFYKYRIESTVNLYKSGKIKAVLVSGDNSTKYYNEPATIRADLIKAGIPKNKIYLDFAGFRTLDSIMRAKKIFNLKKVTIVTQKFHLERAIFLAKAHNLDAIGFEAKSLNNTKAALKMEAREYLARTKAFLDVYILHTTPKFFGKYEKIDIKESENR